MNIWIDLHTHTHTHTISIKAAKKKALFWVFSNSSSSSHSRSIVSDFVTPQTVARQAPLSMEFPRLITSSA